ncbi:MAG: DUF1080 domain-containing protein [Planctomycetales bacterium]|nr:DUF1080 domain-containing protein [Planctomycetales bacterium]
MNLSPKFPSTSQSVAVLAFLFLPIMVPRAQQVHAQEHFAHRFAVQELTDTYYSEGISVGDVSGDGIHDVVYGPYWFEGPTFQSKHEIYPAVAQPMERYADNFFSWVYDFDGDGAQDVFVVGFPGTPAYVYQNPGRGVGQWTKHTVFDWVSNESPQFVSIVGDQQPELVCTRDGFFGFATIDWDHPFDAWKFHPISEQVTATKFGHGLGIGDVNGDGLADLLHAAGWFEQPKQNAVGQRWRSHEVAFSNGGGGAEMYAYDVDGDGDSDVITSESAHNFGLSWYEQVAAGDELQFKRHTIMGQRPTENKYGLVFSELHSVALADMDGDGLKDIVTGKTYWSHHKQSPMWDAGPVVYWFKLVRNEDGVDWLPYLVNDQSGIGRQLVIVDINGDQRLDVATGGMLGAHITMHTLETVTHAEFKQSQPVEFKAVAPNYLTEAPAQRGPKIIVSDDGMVPGAYEAENLPRSVSAGQARPQQMNGFKPDRWSGGSQLWWTGAKPGDTLAIEIDVLSQVNQIQLALTCARDYGIVQLLLDDKPLGEPIDLYAANVSSTGQLTFEIETLSPGKHTVALKIAGANPASSDFMVGLDYLQFSGGEAKIAPANELGIKPRTRDGRELNLDFESGTLVDWTAEGSAFADQPIVGDTVNKRRRDMHSRHVGKYWIGGYEKVGDEATGTLTSLPFIASARYASFYIGGGNSPQTQVELWAPDEEKPFFTVSGNNTEDLSRVVVDVRRVQGAEMFIRLVDKSSGGWGHINFDHFRLHADRPGPLTSPSVQLVADEYPYRGLTAEEAAEAMVVPEGFHVQVCAAEPDVKQPIAMALDDRGRVWIAEAYEYPVRAAGDKGRDRVLVFEDTNGDGKLDSRKVFCEGLNLVSGLEVGFGGVWVGAAPYLLFIPDANGDDVPDAEPQVLLDGWGFQDTHETLNAFCWGPDGWLYGCHGVFTHSRVGRPGTPDAERIPLNAAVWRYHPTQHQFEVFAHGTSNPWGVDFNQYGDAFVTACVIPHLYHMIQGARYERQAGQHFNAYTYDDIKTIADHLHYLGATPHSGNGKSDEAGGGHAHAGAMIYQGGAWPKQYDGALFMNNIHGQRLNIDLLEPAGSGYVGRHAPDFLLTGDLASQILNMRYGPDGQVLFIDWYDMQACHRKEVEVHDRSNGRIYKVGYGDWQPVKVDLRTHSDLELAELCTHANDWFVRHSRRILQERAAERSIDGKAIELLESIASSHSDPTRRLRALWASFSIRPMSEQMAAAALADNNEHVRSWALQLLMQQSRNQLSLQYQQRIAQMASSDSSPVVRRAIASALGRLPLTDRWEIAESLLTSSFDRDDHNLPLLYWYAIEPLAEVDPDRALALAMVAGNRIPLLRTFMLRRVAGSGSASALDRIVAALGKTELPEVQLSFLSAIQQALTGRREASMPAGWPEVFEQLNSSRDMKVRLTAAAIGVTFGDQNSNRFLLEFLADGTASPLMRDQALSALLARADSQLVSTLVNAIRQNQWPASLIDSAIRGLRQFDSPEVGPLLVGQYSQFSPEQKLTAIATLCSRSSNARYLLDAIADSKIPAADLTADLARQLEYLNDPAISQQLKDVWGVVRKTAEEKALQIEQYRKLVASKNPPVDVALGRAIFAKTCQRCHVLYGIGERIGPDLTGSNRANLDYLLENIVDPSAVMAKEYQQSIFITENGQLITGILQSETPQAITLRTADATVVLPVDEILERKESAQSMMPDNQLSQFTEHETRSLIAYLQSKQQSPMRATADNSSLLFNQTGLEGWHGNPDLWRVEQGEIVGISTGFKRNEFLVSDMLAADFRLELEILLTGNVGNSGIQFRSKVREDQSVEGYQADVGAGWWGKLYEEHGRGLLWEASGEKHVKEGQWNRYVIEARGSKLNTWINDQPCVDLDDTSGAQSGIFAIQLHSGGPTEVRVRNLKLTVFDD